MTEQPEIAVGDRVEVVYSHLGPDGEREPGTPRRRYWGTVVQVDEPVSGERLTVKITHGEPPSGTGIGLLVAPHSYPGTASVRVVPSVATWVRSLAGPAPEHLVRLVAGAAPFRCDPHGGSIEQQQAAWRAHVQRVTDAVWFEAWHRGAHHGATEVSMRMPAQMLVVTEAERERITAEIMGATS
jgi:hypothetical protein